MTRRILIIVCSLLLLSGCTEHKAPKPTSKNNSEKPTSNETDTKVNVNTLPSGLRYAIENEIAVGSGVIAEDNLKSITKLTIEPKDTNIDEGKYDFSLVGKMTNLQELTITSMRAKDFTFLKELKNLKTLTISGYYSLVSMESQAYDLSPAKNLTSLENLSLEIPLKDYTFLNGLNLKQMKITGGTADELIDLSALNTSKQLTQLEIINANLPNYDFLSFPNLDSITISTNSTEMKDLSGLQTSTNLRQLDLNGIQVKSFSFLKKTTKLESISLYATGNRDLENLQISPKMKVLTFDEIKMPNVNMLSPLKNLEFVTINHANTTDIVGLKNNPSIQMLSLVGNPLRSIDVLATLKNLQTLDISGTEVKSVAALRGLPNLKTIYGDKNKVTDYKQLPKKVTFGEKNLAK